jgi:hypothetical protein
MDDDEEYEHKIDKYTAHASEEVMRRRRSMMKASQEERVEIRTKHSKSAGVQTKIHFGQINVPRPEQFSASAEPMAERKQAEVFDARNEPLPTVSSDEDTDTEKPRNDRWGLDVDLD